MDADVRYAVAKILNRYYGAEGGTQAWVKYLCNKWRNCRNLKHVLASITEDELTQLDLEKFRDKLNIVDKNEESDAFFVRSMFSKEVDSMIAERRASNAAADSSVAMPNSTVNSQICSGFNLGASGAKNFFTPRNMAVGTATSADPAERAAAATVAAEHSASHSDVSPYADTESTVLDSVSSQVVSDDDDDMSLCILC